MQQITLRFILERVWLAVCRCHASATCAPFDGSRYGIRPTRVTTRSKYSETICHFLKHGLLADLQRHDRAPRRRKFRRHASACVARVSMESSPQNAQSSQLRHYFVTLNYVTTLHVLCCFRGHDEDNRDWESKTRVRLGYGLASKAVATARKSGNIRPPSRVRSGSKEATWNVPSRQGGKATPGPEEGESTRNARDTKRHFLRHDLVHVSRNSRRGRTRECRHL